MKGNTNTYAWVRIWILFAIAILTPTLTDAIALKGTSKNHENISNQAKRDLSLSYSATNINSKEGTRIKTITVIKNIGKHEKLAINPELHKNKDWANAFRDNFDSYGKIPDVPDIDDLFEFVNKKEHKEEKENNTEEPKEETTTEKDVKPVVEQSAEETTAATEPAEKIKGDAEVLSAESKQELKNNNTQSQSLSAHKRRVSESLNNLNNASSQNTVQKHFENYVQLNEGEYMYAKPCPNVPANSVSVSTSSGRKYDIPVEKSNVINPYIAPAIVKKTQVPLQSNSQNIPALTPTINAINSLLPPLQSPTIIAILPALQQGFNNAIYTTPLPTVKPTPPQQGAVTTSQRPYIAPNLQNGLGISLGPPPVLINKPRVNDFRTRSFAVGGRSRGLKY
ncbi:uncharacterized protein LOC119678477 [Teleopsis dalmanni]|uniref:uncharacterized protein LOC119678477 n=1 Tax=Teleopsis dalmanni TaxID=139649 RepID=UPI0018CFA94A|nr:uncharacterized protein LOC119678477 [Teleopsis dalmanni]